MKSTRFNLIEEEEENLFNVQRDLNQLENKWFKTLSCKRKIIVLKNYIKLKSDFIIKLKEVLK